jgi:hypothetical protein
MAGLVFCDLLYTLLFLLTVLHELLLLDINTLNYKKAATIEKPSCSRNVDTIGYESNSTIPHNLASTHAHCDL